jgi:small subunit ribosomal protein S20
LANIQSAKKRWRQSLKRRERNRLHVGAARTAVARARRDIAAGNAGEAEASVRLAIEALDRAAERGTIHRNNSSRRKSRLMKSYNLMVAEQTAAAAEAASGEAKPARKRTAAKKTDTGAAKTKPAARAAAKSTAKPRAAAKTTTRRATKK